MLILTLCSSNKDVTLAEIINLKARGLVTHPNDLAAVPEGALSVADNVVIDKENKLSPRRGIKKHSELADVNDRASKLFTYQSKLLAAYTGSKLAYYNSGWNAYSGSYDAPTDHKIRAAESNSNFYFTTSLGVKKLDSYSSTPTFAGAPQGLDGLATLSGASGYMTNDSQVAYRIVWGYRDANDNLIIGAPSQRITIANSSGGTRDVSLSFTIPDSITTSWFYQIYRSALSATASIDPSDELGLVYEANPSGAQITAKTITVVDQTPTTLRGADLYSNDSQEGILQANTQPPLARDVASYKGYMLYANTTSKHRLFLDLIAAGTLANDDVLTVAGVTYTAKATENVGSRHFLLATGGTPAQNITDTAQSIVRVINQSSSTTLVYAYYISGSDDLPGKLLIEERGLGGSAFTVQLSAHGTAFNPDLTSAQSSSNDRGKNLFFWSKSGEPEAVPLLNNRRVGSADSEILRVAALRDSVFFFKSEGIYRLTGEDPNSFVVDLFDGSTKLISPESVQVLNNQIYCFTDQGIVSVSEAGVEVKSRAIETTLLELLGANQTIMGTESHGVAYESDRKYIFSTISNSADSAPTQMFVYNVFTDSWTRWDLGKKAGIVLDKLLYFSDADSSDINVERKSYTFTDYVDESLAITITSSSAKSVNLVSTVGISVGDVLYQSSSKYSIVTEVTSFTQVQVFDTISWSAAAAEALIAFECLVEWWPATGGNPGILKQFQELVLLFNVAYFTTSAVRFYSDQSSSIEEVDIDGNYGSAWGLFQWGGVPWGGDSFRSAPVRTYIPRNKQRCSQLSVQYKQRVGYGQFEIQGLHLSLRPISNRLGR